jgi:pyruvate,water dikinase
MSLQQTLTLSNEDLQVRLWNQDGLHFGHPLSPLFASYMIPSMTEGTRQAMEAVKAPTAQFICKMHDGYFYQSVVAAPGDPELRLKQHLSLVEPLWGKIQAEFQSVLTTILWPMHQEIDALTATLHTMDDARQALERLQAIYLTFWDWHFRIVAPRSALGIAFEQLFQKAFPDRDPVEAYELLLGTMNKSLEQDRALWQLAQRAQTEPAVLAALNQHPIYPALLANPATASFRRALTEYLDVYGWRTIYAHEFLYETWRENPEYCLSILKGYVEHPFDFDARFQAVVAAREDKSRKLFALVHDPALKSALQDLQTKALEGWSLDEDHHFYIDAMLPARSRGLVMRVGQLLVDQQILAQADDVCFLYLDELLEGLSGRFSPHLSAVIARRRSDLERQRALVPPPELGANPDHNGRRTDLVGVRIFGMGAPTLEKADGTVRGFGAAPGQYVGPVRIVHGPDEFFKVKPGDVLVCRNTAPSWTGLFAIVGAVITETGGILSHAATVAREYHLPCIVGTREATRVFRDGQRVAVDGSAGVAAIDG